MKPEGTPTPWWARDVRAFVGFTFLNFVLVCGGGCGLSLIGSTQMAAAWFWVFAFPVMLVDVLWGLDEVTFVFPLLLNPLVYGVMWWFAWRMFRLMRPKPTEDGSPPLHNE
jgi:hypothetical protein